jgi:hypothetical protein
VGIEEPSIAGRLKRALARFRAARRLRASGRTLC